MQTASVLPFASLLSSSSDTSLELRYWSQHLCTSSLDGFSASGDKVFSVHPPPVLGKKDSSSGTVLTYVVSFNYTAGDADSNTQVSIRAFLPLWVFLYVLQFLFMPLIARDYWVSNFFGNTMYLFALGYYFVITFLGYNGERECPCASRLSFD
jgi:hypothetical protein